MDGYQLAWALYALGAVGCGVAAWLLFRRFGREWAHFFMITVWVLLLTPYSLEAETMVMAPALFIIVMDGLANGFDSVKSITMLLLGLWLIALVISLIYLLVTRRRSATPKVRAPVKARVEEPSYEESRAREELLDGETPLRAER